jgi:hypothetical protein
MPTIVARYDRQPGVGQFSIDDMHVGAAHGAGFDPKQNLARLGHAGTPCWTRSSMRNPP